MHVWREILEAVKLGAVVLAVFVAGFVGLIVAVVLLADDAALRRRGPGGLEAAAFIEDGPTPFYDVLRVAIAEPDGRTVDLDRAEIYELQELSLVWERDRLWVHWGDDIDRRLTWFERREDGWERHVWHVPYDFVDEVVVASYCDVALDGIATLPPPPAEVLPDGFDERFRREAEARGWPCDRERP
jgi:hypothetical protein